ncbi:MAG: hypothetical protein CMJ41_09180 [Phycisphaerae bacterium]|nr:hypothetical protein [Phycisphaerae bacterium]
MSVLVTGATGMFGSGVVTLLDRAGVEVLAMSRSEANAARMTRGNVTGVVADLDDPATLPPLMERADRVFVVSPIHPDLGLRECNVIEAAVAAGVGQIVKLYGSVRHDGDQLDVQHRTALAALRDCGVPWTLVSPQTVMETNLLGQLEGIKHERSMFGAAGEGRIGMVALADCVETASIVLQAAPADHAEANLEITGPAAMTYPEIAAEMSRAFGETITYVDMSEDAFAAMLIEYGVPAEDVELQVLCHFRQMRAGRADLVTDTFERIAGRPATSVYEWTRAHRSDFGLE